MASQACPIMEENKCDNFGRCCTCIAAHCRYGKPVSCMVKLGAK